MVDPQLNLKHAPTMSLGNEQLYVQKRKEKKKKQSKANQRKEKQRNTYRVGEELMKYWTSLVVVVREVEVKLSRVRLQL